MTTRLKGIRQHLRITLPDREFEVWTKPFDYDLHGIQAKKHDWSGPDENPVGYLLFLSWSAARRSGEIDATLGYESYKALVENLEELEEPPVDPTQPAAGDDSSPG